MSSPAPALGSTSIEVTTLVPIQAMTKEANQQIRDPHKHYLFVPILHGAPTPSRLTNRDRQQHLLTSGNDNLMSTFG
ncbi:hypothetical protein P153DRAFT_371285 [Dothidotthia symphoricarpi CBS 119687]|uniref:Uncharacterized protein n=1 Tax=Dothidotthia symphoricarpi CBS 119687 TaxID=1392245 RepID=A0A6A5ZXH6_9PLEO|nr:uncharacterized protein P153DRAFT_371285 [Dothidotthia symphoricarpi CBS 119687]KAF2123976.1 hypothetical protein P153DRAFT_371285 [Dothidotthia symphoricarpi CBS 119687]